MTGQDCRTRNGEMGSTGQCGRFCPFLHCKRSSSLAYYGEWDDMHGIWGMHLIASKILHAVHSQSVCMRNTPPFALYAPAL